ncbi:TRAP transporter permease [Chelativorans alearense]|uniref:TRAP transporter permease n=1 Tax=Chelativorans alearense TaxID=2681495 RepID=UPI0013D69AD6|nr:TRAP transporter fused permease subunit [Chelativorans alearense]
MTTQARKSPLERVGYAAAGLFSLAIMLVIAFFALDEANARFGTIAISAAIVILTSPAVRIRGFERRAWLSWLFDGLLVASFIWSAWWFFKVKAELWTGFYMATPMNIAAGLAGVISLVLLTVRAWGWSLVIMAAAFVLFAFAGPWLPGLLEHFGVGISDFMQIVWYSFDGVFGRTTGLVADNVLIFLIFGAVLERTGAGQSLIHLSTALTARIRGGAAHAAIVASAVFGMMSGSVAANIAGTGVFTIPMIKRQGFSANFAGAVETAASSGGQLTPPIMAAAVFVMADLVGMPFAYVIAAAALPALFKYIGLFSQVYAEAIRLDIKTLRKEDIPTITPRDWVNSALVFLPIAALMATFILGKSPATAGLVGVLTAIGAGIVLNPEFRRKPGRIAQALTDGGISAAQIMLAVGVIGIVLAVINETGVAIRFATSISAFGEDFLLAALVLAMFGALILGMGLPTLPAYLIIAIMIAPAIVKAGVPPIAAHMFVLYYAVYSSIVPPIAYGCYVAAPIAGGHPLGTAFVALRISIVGLLVPYVFVYSPSLLLVADGFSWSELTFAVLRLLAAIWMFGTSLGGADPIIGRLALHQRALRLVLGAACLIPIAFVWVPAAALAVMAGLSWKRLLFRQPDIPETPTGR